MKETEITVQVYESIQQLHEKLLNNNFSLAEKCVMEDYYFSKFDTSELKKMSYKQILKSSILVRKCRNDTKIVYKNKEIDKDNNVICEEKITLPITDIKPAIKIFELSGLNNWCNITQEMYLYKNNKMEFMVQVVDGLGIFIEYEEDEENRYIYYTQMSLTYAYDEWYFYNEDKSFRFKDYKKTWWVAKK